VIAAPESRSLAAPSPGPQFRSSTLDSQFDLSPLESTLPRKIGTEQFIYLAVGSSGFYFQLSTVDCKLALTLVKSTLPKNHESLSFQRTSTLLESTDPSRGVPLHKTKDFNPRRINSYAKMGRNPTRINTSEKGRFFLFGSRDPSRCQCTRRPRLAHLNGWFGPTIRAARGDTACR
jgi:hypothetical protein